MPDSNEPIVIVGGGVAGLATAAGLLAHGQEIALLDRGWIPKRMGMGFILLRSGLDALAELFPGIRWGHVGAPVLGAKIMSSTGELLDQRNLDVFAISRGTMLETMLEALPPGTLDPTAYVASIDADPDRRVRAVVCEDGRRIPCRVLIGADGIRSNIRRWMHPNASLAEVQHREVVSIIDAPDLAEALGTTFIKFYDPEGGLAVGAVNVGQGQVVWFVQHDVSRYDWAGLDPAGLRWAIFTLIARWPDPVTQLWSRTDFTRSHLWHVADMDPDYAYAHRNLFLIGDAAHPVLSFTSHGATGALEDASMLVPLLAEAEDQRDIEFAGREYDETRRELFERVVFEGRELLDRFLLPLDDQGGVPLPLVK